MAGEEPAFLPVGTDVSAKYRGAFCEAKVKIIKRLVKCKINFIDAPNGVVSDDNIKGNLKVGAVVEAKHPETDIWTKGTILKLTDASTYTVVFDDGDEKTLRRTSLCLQGERHFNESETLDHLPLTDPENFGTPVMRESHSKKKQRLSTRSQGDDENDDDEDSDGEGSSRTSRKDDRDDSIGKVIVVETNDKRKNAWFPALVVDPTTAKDIQPKSKDHVVARSFKDNRYYSVDKQSRRAFAHRDHNYKGDLSSLKTAVERAVHFVETGQLPSNWDAEISKRNRGASGGKKGKNDRDKGETEEDEEEGTEDESDDDEYDEEKDAWLASLHKFMEERGTPINKPPVLGFRDLNLYKLYKLVQDLGGCRKVTDKQKWRYVATKMGIPAVTTSQPYNIKAAYNKYLYAFEDYNRKLGPGIARSLPRTRRRSSYGEQWPMPTLPVLTKMEKTPPQSKKSQGSDSEEDLSITSPRSKKKVSKKSDAKTKKDTPDKKETKTKEKDRKDDEKQKEKQEKEKREKEREEEREKEKADEERKEKEKKEKEKLAKDKKEKKDEKEKDADQKAKRLKEREKDGKRQQNSRTMEGPGKKDEETELGTNKQEQKLDVSSCVKPDFEIGEKIKVQYGRGRTQKIYEAKIVDYEIEGGKVVYTIHYMGWNVRFDEVITADRILGWAEKKRERQQREQEKQQKEKELEAERKEKEKEENERREKERMKREQEKAREKEQKDREKRERDAKEKREREAKEKEDAERKEREEIERKEQETKLKKMEKEQELKKVSEDKAEDKKSKNLGKRGRPSTSKTPTPTAIPTTTPGRSTPPHDRSTSRSPVSSRSYPTRARRSDRKSLSESPFASGLPTKSRPRRSSGYSESATKSERSWSDSENDELEENSSQESESQIPETKDDISTGSTTDRDKLKTDLEATVSRPQEVLEKIEDSPDEVTKDKTVDEKVLRETEERKEQEDVKDKLPEIVEEKNDGQKKAEIVEDETAKESEEEKPPNLTPQKELLAQPEEPTKKKEKRDKKESKKEAKSRSKKEGKAKKDQTRQSSGDAKKDTKGKKDGGKKSQPKVDAKEKESSISKEELPKERREPELREESVPVEPEEEVKKRKGRKRRRRKSQEGRSKGDEGKDEPLAEPQEKKKKDPDQKHTKKLEITKPEAKQDSKEASVDAENLESAKALSEPSSSSGKTPFTYKGRLLLSTPPTSPENSPAAPSSPAAQEPAKGSVHEADDEHVSGKSDSDAMIEVASVVESNQGPRRHSPHHDASSSSSSADIGTAHLPTPNTDTRTVKPDSGDNISPKKRKRNTSESEPTRKRSRKRNRRQSSVASSVAERRRSSNKDVPRNSSSDTDETHSDVKHSLSGHRSEGGDLDRMSTEALSKVSSSSSSSKVEGQLVQRKWNFLIDVSHIQDPEERISLIQRQLNDLRKIYMQLKTEVATIDRRRKKYRRKEREAAAAAALSNQKQVSEKKSTDST